jgi:archaetidylinositol phosphate synthase
MEGTDVATTEFVNAARMMTGLSAPFERRALAWLAARVPARIGSDHLTSLGAVAMFAAGCCYWLAGTHRLALLGVVVCLAVNWLGDSLDGTVARVRHRERPRYGFYVDHVLDMFGACFLLAGLALSGLMTPLVALGLLVAFLMLCLEVFLATYCTATFRLGFARIGPTELRIVLAIGTLVLLVRPEVHAFGRTFLLFDLGGSIAAVGIVLVLVISTVRHTIDLYRAEPLSRSGH